MCKDKHSLSFRTSIYNKNVMKYFTYPQCNNEFVRATKKDYKLYPNNNLIKSKYISLIGDTYTAIENIEEVLNDLTELEKLKEIISKEDTSFANVILGTSNYGKNNSYYRAYLSIDGKNVIEIRIANHYETKRTALGKSNNLSQFIYQVVLITDPPKVKQSDSIVTTTSVANLKILTKGIISKDSSIEELSSMLKSIHDYLISPNSEWENNSTQQINCNTNMNKNKIRLTESTLHKIIKESVKRILQETRFGKPQPVFGNAINGKSAYLINDTGRMVAVIDNLKFYGNSIIGENRATEEKVTFYLTGLFGHSVDGSTLPGTRKTKDGLYITHLQMDGGDEYYELLIDDFLLTPESAAEWDYYDPRNRRDMDDDDINRFY